MSFAEFKNALLEYFSNPNAVIQLQNEFNTIKQNTGRVRPAHPNSLPEAITLARVFELAEKEANHSQIVNMIMEENKTKTLEKRVIQLGEELSKKIESYLILDPKRNTYQPFQRCSQENQNTLVQRNPNHAGTNQQTNPNYQNYQQTYLNIPENLIIGNNDSKNINRTKNSSNKLSQTIPPAVATKDSSLAAIFPFELEKNKAMFSRAVLDEKRPITAMYMEATVNNTPIKLILDSRSAGSIVMLQLVNQLGFKVDYAATSQIITADGNTKLPHSEIDSFSFEINGIVIPTKVLVMNVTQY
ncbi:hypothetical protein G9A89_023225 [Geosiphon pyriformis]|nr:hypothetical protein G9A89_023225 [Geosiphon pyriformis]